MYINRELSWLKFNERVLEIAENKELPLLERLKFIGIYASNLDEFFMVRVATLNDQLNMKLNSKDSMGFYPEKIIDEIYKEVLRLNYKVSSLSNQLIEELEINGLKIIRKKDYSNTIDDFIKDYFRQNIFPVITPMAVDLARPFPLISNRNLYVASKLLVDGVVKLAIVEVPSIISRLISLDIEDNSFLLLEDIIENYLSILYQGYEVLASCQFRITRNGDISVLMDDSELLLNVIEEAIKYRKWGEVIRLEITKGADSWIVENLVKSLQVNEKQIYYIDGIMDMTLWIKLYQTKGFSQHKLPTYIPNKNLELNKKNIFKAIKNEDIFIHNPFDSFDPIVNLVKIASKDPKVLAIKQTLYRVSGNSEIVKALGEAAEKGKQVTVLLELMARFDEENNINWAKKLEQKGVHVIYGLPGLKTHSKILLIVRKENNSIKRYVHLGTGNYNDQTAKIYTDMSIITCDESIGSDASKFFNIVTGFTKEINTSSLIIAPFSLRKKIKNLIHNEINISKAGGKGKIIAKMNSLVDKEIIDLLYTASNSGVEITLIIRGICSLASGIAELSKNIRVISVVGEFLEHSRIFYFENGGNTTVYLSSADWMTRNLDRRIELMFPVNDEKIKTRILSILNLYTMDNTNSWIQMQDGTYYKKQAEDSKESICSVHKKLKEFNYEGL